MTLIFKIFVPIAKVMKKHKMNNFNILIEKFINLNILSVIANLINIILENFFSKNLNNKLLFVKFFLLNFIIKFKLSENDKSFA